MEALFLFGFCCMGLLLVAGIGLLVWFLVKQKPQQVAATPPMPPGQQTIASPDAAHMPPAPYAYVTATEPVAPVTVPVAAPPAPPAPPAAPPAPPAAPPAPPAPPAAPPAPPAPPAAPPAPPAAPPAPPAAPSSPGADG
jgi:putative membrane protein